VSRRYLIKKSRRGIVGIEAAIVLIAFVIVAAALAFVVLNMGFFTTQRSKEAIGTGLKEASSALEVDGSVVGETDGSSQLVAVAIPLKTSTGKNPIDLSQTIVKIRTTNKVIILNDIARITSGADKDPFTALGTNSVAFIQYQGDGDNLLEVNEKWVLVINLTSTDVLGAGLGPYSTLMVEIKPPTGAPLTVERTVPPNLSDQVIVLEG